MPRLALGFVCAFSLVEVGSAAAESAGNLDLSSFRPAMDSRGFLTLNGSQVLGDREVSFGLGALDWGHKMLTLDGAGNTYSIDNTISATLIAALGLRLGPAAFELGVSAPFRIMNGDRGPDLVDPQNHNNDKDYRVDGQGLGAVGAHLKLRLLDSSRRPKLGLAVIGSLWFGGTTTKGAFMGDDTLVPQVMGVVDKDFGRVRVALNGGVRFRKSTTFVNDDPGVAMAPVTNGEISAGTELPFGVGVAYAVAPQRFDVVGEVFGALPLGGHDNYQPLEAIGGVKLYLARNSFLALGAGRGLLPGRGANPEFRAFIGIVFEPTIGDRDGDGIKDDVDRCPDQAEDFDDFEDEDGCPEPDNDHDGIDDVDDKCPNVPEDRDGIDDEDGCPEGEPNDRDGDRILDKDDKCPDDPEDFDGFQDEDGCPELDNDGDKILDVDDLCPNDPEDFDHFEDEDGCPEPDNDHDRIPDKEDKCPNEPETYNGYRDGDGCPDKSDKLIITDTGFVPLEPINFEYNKAIIKADSFPVLDAVVATIQGNPDILQLEVQGHTDERGDDLYNLELSIRRAAAVLAYLVDHGVAANRLTSEGYGETQPKDKRHQEAAWAINRRVEFVILKREAGL